MGDELRYGVIGTGMMGVEHVHNLRALPGARVAALADPYPPSLDAARAAAGDDAPATFADHRALLDAGGFDALVVASPNHTHVGVLADVLDTGLPVLVEKPLCTTVADCRRVVEHAARTGTCLIVGERPVRVQASGAQDVNHLDERYGGRTPDILDNAFVLVDFPSGARACLDLCMFADATRNAEELSVVGERGKVEALVPEGVLRVGRRGEHWIGRVDERTVVDDRVAYEDLHHGASYVEHLHFQRAVRGEAPVPVTLDDGLWSVATGVAAHRAIDEGRPVMLDEVLAA